MLETYSKTSNPMMHRPVVEPDLLDWIRQSQTPVAGDVATVLDFARQHNIPVIPPETVNYFQMLLSLLQPKEILEIGTAIGFSALMMAQVAPKATVTTIERNPEMFLLAKENFQKYDKKQQIILKTGDAAEVLGELPEKYYDVIFMDSAKSKYIEFLPRALELLTENGVILMDDIFQAGEILKPIMEIKRSQRSLERGLRKLFAEVLDNPKYQTSILPLGDGLLMIKPNL